MTRQPGKRLAMGLAAAAYAREHLDRHRVAGQFARFMDHVLEVAREPVAKTQ
ncbi:MAG TPA: hypothetical protein VLE70_00785 [Anaerolineae bacterium]|nr:hypothetical protein [Anaerolineae bacterium]